MNTFESRPLQSSSSQIVALPIRIGLGAVAGLAAGLLYGLLLSSQHMSPMMSPVDVPGDQITNLVLSTLVGVGYGLLFGGLATTAGAGLVWGIVFGVLWWIVGPLTLFPFVHGVRPDWAIASTRAAFPLLVGLAVAYGAFMGLLYSVFTGLYQNRKMSHFVRRLMPRVLQALVSGGLAGLLGGLAFGAWMAQAGFFPLVAGLINSDSAETGRGLHLLISIVIGASYGVLFRRDIGRMGSSIAWGAVYGLIWWILGPLTLMPWLLGQGVQWNMAAAQDAFASLIGHIIYGIVLGMTYAFLSRVWQTLFVDSDPLSREPEGPGTRNLRAIGLGAAASIAGGLVFTVVMVATDTLPKVANIAGMSTPVEGFVVHMAISVLIGASYGLLFRREAVAPMSALLWGIVYGLVWWFLGPLTLFPLLLGQPLQWSLDAALRVYPALVGHLSYGAGLGLVYPFLLRRYDPHARTKRGGHAAHEEHQTAAPALWVLMLVLGMLLPLILMSAAAV